MLLGHVLLISDDERATVARVWGIRERIELQARDLFAGLAADLEATGEGGDLVAAARQASRDEARHAARCRALVRQFAPEAAPAASIEPLRLGPPDLPRARRALFTSVALSCVTETLSTALLVDLRRRAVDPAVRATVNEILKDEVDHARLGWCHLAAAARRDSVAWLSPHVAAMLHAAIGEAGFGDDAGLDGYGILPRSDAVRIMREVAVQVLSPGLAQFGIATVAATV